MGNAIWNYESWRTGTETLILLFQQPEVIFIYLVFFKNLTGSKI